MKKLLLTPLAIATGFLIEPNPSVSRQLLLVLLGMISGAILMLPLKETKIKD